MLPTWVVTRGRVVQADGTRQALGEREDPTDWTLDMTCIRSPTGRRRAYQRRYVSKCGFLGLMDLKVKVKQ